MATALIENTYRYNTSAIICCSITKSTPSLKEKLHFQGCKAAEVLPTQPDTSASLWSSCTVSLPVDSAVCLRAKGEGDSLEEHGWEVIEFEGKLRTDRGRRAGSVNSLARPPKQTGKVRTREGFTKAIHAIRLHYHAAQLDVD